MLSGITYAQTPEVLTAPYGPPATANEWTKYTIPLTAATFNVSEEAFQQAMANITSLWIRTEMHSGYDVGGLDEVRVGDAYLSNFDSSSESWTSGGDGTMTYVPSGGVNGGYIQIEDWATGDWHYMISPFSWAGNWSGLIGQDIEFWMKTDKPSYAAEIRLTTTPISRLALNVSENFTIPLNDSLLIQVAIDPVSSQDVTVTLSSSSNTCITIPPQAVIPAGESQGAVYAHSAPGATMGCQSVIEATNSSYLTSRLVLKIDGYAGVNDMATGQEVFIHPNPVKDVFNIHNTSGKKINRIMIFDISGNVVLDLKGKDLSNQEIKLNQSAGTYLLKVYMQNKVLNTKMIVQ